MTVACASICPNNIALPFVCMSCFYCACFSFLLIFFSFSLHIWECLWRAFYIWKKVLQACQAAVLNYNFVFVYLSMVLRVCKVYRWNKISKASPQFLTHSFNLLKKIKIIKIITEKRERTCCIFPLWKKLKIVFFKN